MQSAIELVPELEQTTARVDIAKDAALTADRDRMLQIVTILLSNATKYGSGQVGIAIFEDAGETRLSMLLGTDPTRSPGVEPTRCHSLRRKADASRPFRRGFRPWLSYPSRDSLA